MAVRRFAGALNPSYTYGKRPESASGEAPQDAVVVLGKRLSPSSRQASGSSQRTDSNRSVSGRTTSGRPANARKHSMGSLIFKPLPAVQPVT
ncbi:MAG: hypothetical protein WDW38_000718 [Sanguina aurantia]